MLSPRDKVDEREKKTRYHAGAERRPPRRAEAGAATRARELDLAPWSSSGGASQAEPSSAQVGCASGASSGSPVASTGPFQRRHAEHALHDTHRSVPLLRCALQ